MTMPNDDPDQPRPNYRGWNVTAGLIFAVAALFVAPAIGLEISAAFTNIDGRVTWATLFVGVFLLACLFWWLLMSWPERFSLWRGAVTGVLVAFFAYPGVIALSEFVQRNWFDGASIPPLGERVDNVLLVSSLTLMTTGFLATPISALVGMVTTWALVHFHPLMAAEAARNSEMRSPLMRILQRLAAVAAVLIVIALAGSFAWLTWTPLDTRGLDVQASPIGPTTTYEQSIAAYGVVQAREAELPLHERCPSTLLTHGRKVARVVIYFHGFTSCPAQGDEFAAQLFALGSNVYLPRMFGHGEADPMTLSLTELTADKLVDLANESTDLVQGLGDEVVVVGLSAGGTIASWTAQYRSDVDQAVIVSPFFGPYVVPPWAMRAAHNLTLMLPNLVLWWNPLENVAPEKLDYAFPRPATHALAEIMRLGRIVQLSAGDTPPAVKRISVLLNEADVAVSNALTEEVIADWREHGADVRVQSLPFDRHLPHDLINPREQHGDPALVYPILIDMMNAP